jgi:DNA-binding transcriptional MerR regulator
VRISELSRLSGVSVASIKYYIREGVLPPGESDGPNKARYGDAHLARLRLIRGLIDAAGVSVAGVKQIAAALDAGIPVNEAFGVAQAAVPITGSVEGSEPSEGSVSRVLDVVHPRAGEHPAVASAARGLDTFVAADELVSDSWLQRYAEAAAIVAKADFDELQRRTDPASQTRLVAVGTAVGDVVFQSLRRIAQAIEGERRFPSPPSSLASGQENPS